MAEQRSGDPPAAPEREPFGSWARLYTLVCVLAIVVMTLLWWFTVTFNQVI